MVVRAIHDQCHVNVTSADWSKLASLSPPDTPPDLDVQDIFFPFNHNSTGKSNKKNKKQDRQDNNDTRARRKGLFVRLDDGDYGRVCDAVAALPHPKFPDLQALFKISKDDGKLISAIMTHIGQWLHEKPFVVTDRSGVKPLLRLDLVPALQRKHGDQADEKSITLQRDVAFFVLEHATALNHAGVKHLVDEYPRTHAEHYCQRFQHPVWLDLLHMVYRVTGPHFCDGVMQHFNHHPPTQLSGFDPSVLPSQVCDALSGLPALTHHTALGRPAALKELKRRLQPVIAEWVADHCPSAAPSLSPRGNADSLSLPAPEDTPRSRRMMGNVEGVYHAALEQSSPVAPRSPSSPFRIRAPASSDFIPESSSPGFEDARQRDALAADPLRLSSPSMLENTDARRPTPQPSQTMQTPPLRRPTKTPHTPSASRTGIRQAGLQQRSTNTGPTRNPRPLQSARATTKASTSVLGKRRLELSSGGRQWRNSPGVTRSS